MFKLPIQNVKSNSNKINLTCTIKQFGNRIWKGRKREDEHSKENLGFIL